MDHNFKLQKYEQLIKQRNYSLVFLILAFFVIIILSSAAALKTHTVIITPSVISEEYQISGRQVSAAYLEDMSRDFITAMLNITPENVEYMSKIILKTVHPAAYGEIKNQLAELQENVIKRKVATIFYPRNISVDEKNLRVVVRGNFHSFVGSKLTEKQEKNFQIQYDYNNSRLTIRGFGEIKI